MGTIQKYVVATALLIAAATALQEPQPPPPNDGPDHHDQPKFCLNVSTQQWAANCECQPTSMADPACNLPDRGAESSKCQVWCRKTACRCKRGCERTDVH